MTLNRWQKPWLFLPAQLAHDLGPSFLKLRGTFLPPQEYSWQPFQWRKMKFANRLGTAGGVDKNAECVRGWWSYGAGFLEIGTVTPEPQGPNPGKIVDRDLQQMAVWNKMGFPSHGVSAVAENLGRVKSRQTPIWINIGKNRTTANEQAHQDYVTCLRKLEPLADAITVNISSPNTKGLRDLLRKENLRAFLQPIVSARVEKPILLKLSPDLETQDLENALQVSMDLNVDGWIVTNTTLARSPAQRFSVEGGVSGRPLAPLARQTLQRVVTALGSARADRLIVAAGGVLSADDVKERLDMGADLVQVYSALILQGPGFFQEVAESFAHSIEFSR